MLADLDVYLFLATACLIVTVVARIALKKKTLAAFSTGLLLPIGILIGLYIENGYLEPLFLALILNGFIIGFIVSWLGQSVFDIVVNFLKQQRP